MKYKVREGLTHDMTFRDWLVCKTIDGVFALFDERSYSSFLEALAVKWNEIEERYEEVRK